jgi:hypothetical protein
VQDAWGVSVQKQQYKFIPKCQGTNQYPKSLSPRFILSACSNFQWSSEVPSSNVFSERWTTFSAGYRCSVPSLTAYLFDCLARNIFNLVSNQGRDTSFRNTSSMGRSQLGTYGPRKNVWNGVWHASSHWPQRHFHLVNIIMLGFCNIWCLAPEEIYRDKSSSYYTFSYAPSPTSPDLPLSQEYIILGDFLALYCSANMEPRL